MLPVVVGKLKSKINGFRKTTLFGIKCSFTKSPLSMISVLSTMMVLVFGIAVRFMEYNSTKDIEGGNDFTLYVNSFWFVGATMTTVGYGDFYPNTFLGRLIAYLIFLAGLFLISLTFGTLMTSM